MKVSVIIPVYKAEQFLEKSVKSASDLDEVQEILLVEDGSPDQSLHIALQLELKFPKVRLLQHPDKGNHGAGATRNLGLVHASQEFIAFLDADDYYLPNRFEAEKELFKDDKIEGVFGALGLEYLSEKGKQEFDAKFKNVQLTTVNYDAEGHAIFTGLMGLNEKTFGTFFHLNTITIRKSSLEKHQLRFNKDLRVHQDSDFIFKLAYHCHLHTGIIDKAIAIRGIHDDNRITKIKAYSSTYFVNQLRLHHSLYEWSKTHVSEDNYKKLFLLKYLSYQSANYKGFKKYSFFLKQSLRYPELLKTRYRFIALKND